MRVNIFTSQDFYSDWNLSTNAITFNFSEDIFVLICCVMFCRVHNTLCKASESDTSA
jgi:hypothetical protein